MYVLDVLQNALNGQRDLHLGSRNNPQRGLRATSFQWFLSLLARHLDARIQAKGTATSAQAFNRGADMPRCRRAGWCARCEHRRSHARRTRRRRPL